MAASSRYIDAILRFRDQFSGEMAKSVGKVTEQEKHLKAVSGQLMKVGRGFTNAGRTLTAGVTMPVVGVGVSAVKTAAEFEGAMSKVQSICGASGEALEQLTAKAQEMGAKTKFSASESAEAFSYMAMAGWKTEDMLNGIEGIMYLAGATGQDLASTSDIVTDALTAFGLTAGDTGHFVDVLAATANNANTNVAMMGESFKYVAPAAGALGYSIDDVSAALGLMANSGIKSSAAGTALRSMLTNLAKPTKGVKAAMDALGISLTDASGQTKPLSVLMGELRGKFANLTEAQKAQYAAAIAGKTGMSGMLAIVNASQEDFDSLTGAIADCTGAAKDMYDVANDNLQGQLTTLKSTVESIMITIGNQMLPIIKKVAEHLQSWAERISGLDERQVEMIMKIAGVVAVLGPALLVIGKVVTTVGKVIKTISAIKKAFNAVTGAMSLMNPTVLIVVAVIAALAAIAIIVYKNWDKIKPVVDRVIEAFKKFWEKCKDIYEKAKTGVVNFVERLKNFGQSVKDCFFKIKDWIFETYNKLKEKFLKMIEKLKSSPGILGAIFKNIKNVIDALKGYFQGIIQFVKSVFTGNWKQAWEAVKKIFSNVFSGLGALLKAPLNAVIGLINSAIGGINKIKVDIPDWVPGIGGKTIGFNIPTIPLLAKGTKDFVGGAAVINEQGGELVRLPSGAQVIPHDQSIRQAVGLGEALASRNLENRLIRMTDVLRERTRTLPELKTAQATPSRRSEKDGRTVKNITIAKIADTVIVREQADADALAKTLAKKLEEYDENCA